MQGEVAGAGLCDEPLAYDSGIWFNSAKFVDLEYGDVPNAAAIAASDAPETLYWQHPNNQHAVRINHGGGKVTVGCPRVSLDN